MRKGKIVSLLVACGCIGLFCPTLQEAEAEEALPIPIPLETPPQRFSSVSSAVPELTFSRKEEAFLALEEKPSLEEEWEMRLPSGREVVLQRLQGKFSVGKRALGIVYHPGATLTLRTGRGLQNYMSWDRERGDRLFLTEEEKIARGFQFAEQVTKSVQALPIPFIGDFMAECLHIGRNLESVNKGIKTKYRLHLNYSEKTFRAAYKESF